MMYGITVSDGSIFTVNVIGAILQSSYFLVYYKYSENVVSISRKTSTVNCFNSFILREYYKEMEELLLCF